MKQSSVLEFIDAQKITASAYEKAVQQGLKVTIAVCDAGGHVILQMRMDGAPPISTLIAPEKARTCILSLRPSKHFEDSVNNGRYSALRMPVMPLEGGEMIIVNGQCIGAVGVSGALASDDAEVARAGITAFGAQFSF